jgi:hypothetical protein
MSAAIRVLVVAEGRSEIGDLGALGGPATRRAKPRTAGFIPPILRRVLGVDVIVEAQKITNLGRYGDAKVPGHGARAAKALAVAMQSDYDLLVFVKDVDRTGATKKSDLERRRKVEAVQAEIQTGFDTVNGAEHVERVKATPCRMIEAWALGDPKAVADVADRKSARGSCPAQPELLWGDEKNPDSDHPKCLLRRVLGRDADAEALEDIAESVSLETLKKSCPESFAPFHQELTRAEARLAGRAKSGVRKGPRR